MQAQIQPNRKRKFNAVDLILLRPELTLEETLKYCRLAVELHTASVYVKPCYLHQVVDAITGAGISIGTVISFPHGGNALQTKVDETKQALTEGADELAVVINIGDILAGRFDLIENEVNRISGLVHMNGGIIKAVAETGYLTHEQIMETAKTLLRAQTDYFVTSTGFGPVSDAFDTIRAIRDAVGEQLKISVMKKVSSFEDLNALLDAGCTSVGVDGTSMLFSGSEQP